MCAGASLDSARIGSSGCRRTDGALSGASRYLELRVGDFLDEVATPDLLPGGGFVAAAGVAMAAGLVTMAARIAGREWAEGRGVAAQAETLRQRITPLAVRNADAYESAVATLRGEGGARGSRDEVIASALERAAEVPLDIAEAGVDVVALAALVAERGEPALRADAAVAALLAHAGVRAAATLVEVNLGTTPDDERIVRAHDLVGAASVALERALAAVH
jgi:formiminotetrahydrofolate cyclodeaminase